MRGKVPKIPIRQALVRPDLWWGCDRKGLFWLGTLSALVGLGGGVAFDQAWLVVLGGLMFWAGREVLKASAKKDPQQLAIWWRSLRYRLAYDARARWDQPDFKPKRWT